MGLTFCAPGDAKAERAAKRVADIQEAACTLVIEHGYDGFTMDELAERVGVSRRTLFNHVPDKASAVLGPFDPTGPDPQALDAFRSGGPHGRLLDDLVHAIDAVADSGVEAAGHHALVDRAIKADAKVMHLVAQRFEVIASMLQDAVTEREGWPAGDLRARTLTTTVLGFIKLTLDELGSTDPSNPTDFTTQFHAVLDADAAVRSAH